MAFVKGFQELEPVFGATQSYYKKAKVLFDGERKWLKSYNTIVASIGIDGRLHKHWDGYSATTMRHVVEFAKQNKIIAPNKARWKALPLEALTYQT